MASMIVILCWSTFLIIFRCCCVAKETTKVRFVVEDDLKNPIFGSNKYNPVHQAFENVKKLYANATEASPSSSARITSAVKIHVKATDDSDVTAGSTAIIKRNNNSWKKNSLPLHEADFNEKFKKTLHRHLELDDERLKNTS